MLEIDSMLRIWVRALLKNTICELEVHVLFSQVAHCSSAASEIVNVKGLVAPPGCGYGSWLTEFTSVRAIECCPGTVLKSDDATSSCRDVERAAALMCSRMPGKRAFVATVASLRTAAALFEVAHRDPAKKAGR